MKKIKKILLFTALIMLLVGVSSASEVSVDSTGTDSFTERVMIKDTDTVSDNANILKENKVNKNIQQNKVSDKKLNENTTKTIDKSTRNTNLKEENTISNWDDLSSAIHALDDLSISSATITLGTGIYTNTGTIQWNNTITILTIEGNGQIID